MTSLQVQSRVQGSIAHFNVESGYKEEAVGIRVRGLPDQVQTGLEVIPAQKLRKQDTAGIYQFSSLHNLRRSPRLLQKTAPSLIVMEDVKLGQIMESPSVIFAQGTLPELRLRGGCPRKHIRRPIPFTSLSVNLSLIHI